MKNLKNYLLQVGVGACSSFITGYVFYTAITSVPQGQAPSTEGELIFSMGVGMALSIYGLWEYNRPIFKKEIKENKLEKKIE